MDQFGQAQNKVFQLVLSNLSDVSAILVVDVTKLDVVAEVKTPQVRCVDADSIRVSYIVDSFSQSPSGIFLQTLV